jgi:hypothetical protein
VKPVLAVTAVLATLMCAVAAAPAGATNECRGLQVCVRVAGPWVLASPGQVEYQLTCPKRYVIGGLDAELTSRRIDVSFVGSLGSPVNPGITTSGSAVFLGRLVHGRSASASFRPHIGCVPSSGGGPRTPTAYHAFAPGKPSVRHVKQVAVAPGQTQHLVAHCQHGEELVAATHAIGFYGDAPPTASLARSVQVTQAVHGQRVALTIHAALAIAGNRAVVQIDLVCAAL